MKRFAMLLCLLAAAMPVHGQDASGSWELTVTTTQRPDARKTSMVLKKDGDKLSGTIVGPQHAELAVTGTQSGSDVSLSFKVSTQDGLVDVAMKGRQDSQSMKGTLDVGAGVDRGDWTAVRSGGTGNQGVLDG